jgi:hypothetical protein
MKRLWFKRKAEGSMRSGKRTSGKLKKHLMTALIGTLGLAGIAGAGYVTWSALQDSPGKRPSHVYQEPSRKHVSVASAQKGNHKSKSSKTMKRGTSCKITKSAKHKTSRHKLKKHVAAKKGKKGKHAKGSKYAH